MHDRELLLLFSQVLHNLRRSLRQKLLIPQLALSCGDPFFDLFHFLLQTVALREKINFLFINQADVKPSSMPCTRQLCQGLINEIRTCSTFASRSKAPSYFSESAPGLPTLPRKFRPEHAASFQL